VDILVLNKNFDTQAIIDTYESFNWTDRYNEAGDFELTIVLSQDSSDLIDYFKVDYYVYMNMSDHLMIIEDISIDTSFEDGDKLIVTGRSLESILDRRVIWNQTVYPVNAHVNSVCLSIVNNAMGSQAPDYRKIPNFEIHSSNDSYILSLKLEGGAQYTGDNVYDVITHICKLKKIGFKVVWSVVNGENKFIMSLYNGTDRTYDATKNPNKPPVIFSPYFENIDSTKYYQSIKTFKTVNLVAGEGEGSARKRKSVLRGGNKYTGLYRREMYTDARDISSQTDDTHTMSNDAYMKLLATRGKEKLAEDDNSIAETFEGEVDYRTSFIYKEDYFLGDIVEVADRYGHETPVRISEITYSFDEEGFSINPSFTVPDDEEITEGD